MKTYKIFIYIKGQFIRIIIGDFRSKLAARRWTLKAYESIDTMLNPDEIVIRNILDWEEVNRLWEKITVKQKQ